MHRRTALCALALLPSCVAPAAPPAVPLPAQAPLTALRIHVHNANRERAEKAENVNLYTIFLRQAVERAFIRAGYRVSVGPDEPVDLVVKITLGDFAISSQVRSEASASMVLLDGERIVEQIAGIVVRNDDAELDERSAVGLVDAVTRSPRIAELARALQTRAAPPERQPAVIADPAAPN